MNSKFKTNYLFEKSISSTPSRPLMGRICSPAQHGASTLVQGLIH